MRNWSLFLFLPLALPIQALPAITATSDSPPPETSPGGCNCSREFKPVCGSDFVTYDNLCKFECHHEDENDIHLLYAGTCCPRPNCPFYRDPVCDNRGQTHSNECTFNLARCLLQRTQGVIIRIVEKGDCPSDGNFTVTDCKMKCEADGPSVCDESGMTHRNECELQRWNCLLRHEGKPEVKMAAIGSCPWSPSDSPRKNQISESSLSTSPVTEVDDEEARLLAESNHLRRRGPKLSAPSLPHFKPREPLQFSDLKAGDDRVTDLLERDSHEDASGETSGAVPEDLTVTTASRHAAGQGTIEDDLETQERLLSGVAFSVEGSVRDANKDVAPSEEKEGSLHEGGNTPVLQSTGRPCSAAKCDKAWKPICDSRGKTHKNTCLFRFAACRLFRTHGIKLNVAHEGECEAKSKKPEKRPAPGGGKFIKPKVVDITSFETSSTAAPPPSQSPESNAKCRVCVEETKKIPVCDNLNQTHASICTLAKFNCEELLQGRDVRVLVHIGHCHGASPIFTLKEEVCPGRCSNDYKPVCDTNGVTHPNLCSFQMFNCEKRKRKLAVASLAKLSECKSAVVESEGPSSKETTSSFECPIPRCGKEKHPICDSDGAVHKNECLFNWARCLAAQQGRTLTIQPDEACQLGSCQTNCSSSDYDPVCGTDFLTYPNQCAIQKAQCQQGNVEPLFKGECDLCLQEPCPQLDTDAPDDQFVCADDGTKTRCEFEMLSCISERKFGIAPTIVSEGRCCPTPETCFAIRDPLCGSDRKTYRNRCFFEIERCTAAKENYTLEIASHGRCPSEFFVEHAGTGSVSLPVFAEDDPKDDASGSSGSNGSGNSAEAELEDYQDDIEGSGECAEDCMGIVYDPVCGNDGRTYASPCLLEKEKCRGGHQELAEAYKGDCCESACPSSWNPVCDNLGRTHQNLCAFGRQRCIAERLGTADNLTVVKYDICGSDDCGAHCPKDYKPVCGTNDETFVNECELRKLNCFIEKKMTNGSRVDVAYQGECCPSHQCAYEFAPVCDNKGRTHANECIYKHLACVEQRQSNRTSSILYKVDGNPPATLFQGQCCNQPCEDKEEPVCDGHQTHKNLCRFRIAQCEAERRGGALTLAYAGPCCALTTNENCNRTGTLCDSDGQTHVDACHLARKQCEKQRTNPTQRLTIIHAGECCVLEHCGSGVEPVCDSLGRTHRSPCHFRNTKCIQDKINANNSMHLAYPGQCCLSDCENTWSPVCDQHGSVYKNKCYFRLKSCELDRRGGGVLLETPCPERRARHLNFRPPPSFFQRLRVF